MLNYLDTAEYKFFEEKRFDDENLPTWEDVKFIFKKGNFKNIESRISDKKATIPKDIWGILKKMFYYKDNSENIPNLREEAIKNEPKIGKYIEEGTIVPFEKFEYKDGKTLLEATKDINVSSFSSMYEYFKRGEHIGTCGLTAGLMGIMFENTTYIRHGNAKPVIGTKNSPNGSHAWIEADINGNRKIIDTSLLVVIPFELKEELGYETHELLNLKGLLNCHDNYDEILYDHYEVLSKYSTKNKASYFNYKEYIKELEKENDFER